MKRSGLEQKTKKVFWRQIVFPLEEKNIKMYG